MICENCGAEFEENARACPFCGADNFVKSKQEHEQTVSKLREEEQRIRSLPKKVANKTTKLVVFVVLAFIVVGMLIALIASVIGRLQVKGEYKSDAALAVKLEELYQNGDYEEIYELTKEVSSTNRSLGKYTSVGTLYQKYQYGSEQFKSDLEAAKLFEKPEYLQSVTYFLSILYICEGLEEKGFVYDEDAAVYYFRDAATRFLKENMCLTEEEINTFFERYASIEKRYEDDRDYSFSMYREDYNAINLESGILIYERLVETE